MDTLFTGIVENRDDPLKLGRCQVRVMGLHSYDKTLLPTSDLPWAYPLQPVTSAAMTGIGHSPIGPVEGTTVVIMFRDYPENQHPIIIGSIGGIPQAQGAIDQEDNGPVLKKDGYLPADQQPVTSDSGDTVTSTAPIQPEDTGMNPASSYQISADGIALLKQYEGLRLKAYQDSAGIWTIGYGSTTINGQPVVQGQTITQAQAEQALSDHINNTVSPALYSKVKAPITQSMFDAMCCFAYNVGTGRFGKSSLLGEVNTTKYEEAANEFLQYNKARVNGELVPITGLTKRRSAESTLFLKDGVPNVSGELQPTQAPADKPPVGTQSTAGITSTGTKTTDPKNIGFKDPKGKYPLYINEPDTNKLARHEDIKKTVVYKKEQSRDKGVKTAQDKTWNQSPIPYNAKYPFNHVYMSESGHILEFDDTEHSERVHLYHRKGTFLEIDANGTQVNRIVGDGYEILERNGFIHIKGTSNVTIDGDSNVRVNNALNVDVHGKTTINVFNDVEMNVSGKMDLSVKEDLKIRAKNIFMEAYGGNINTKASNSMFTQSGFTMNYKAGASYNVDSAVANINSGTAGSAKASGLAVPSAKESPELPEFSDLVVVSRKLQAASVYETPEEGDPTNYINKRLDEGTLDKDEKDSGTEQKKEAPTKSNVPPLPKTCDIIANMDNFTADMQLSSYFKLGQLTQNGTRMPVDQVGLTKQEIVCNMKGLCENVLDKIYELYPGMTITSGFRRPGDVAGSSKTSQHYTGQAADIVIRGFNREKHYEAIKEIQKIVPYDQLLLEYSGADTVWIHVSFSYDSNRKQMFTMRDHKRVSDFGTFSLIT